MNIKSTTYLDRSLRTHAFITLSKQSRGPQHGSATAQDKYLPVYCSPSTFGSSVSATDQRIVDRVVFALTGGCGRYADVICNHPSSTGMSTLPFYCTVQIKGVKQLRIFPPASIMLWLSSSPSRIRKVGDIHGTLSLGSDGSLLACQR